MDPHEQLKQAGVEQATMVGGARVKASNYTAPNREAAPE